MTNSFFYPLYSQVQVLFQDFSLQLVVFHLIMSKLKFRKCNLMPKESIHTLAPWIVPLRHSSQEDHSSFTLDSLSIVLELRLMLWYISLPLPPSFCARVCLPFCASCLIRYRLISSMFLDLCIEFLLLNVCMCR